MHNLGKNWADRPSSAEMGYQYMFLFIPHKPEPYKSFYLDQEWKSRWWFDGIWPFGAEETTSDHRDFRFPASVSGEINRDHYVLSP